jgi:hypothetical protein
VGLWFDGPMSNVRVTRNVIVDQIADGRNFHTGVTDSVVRDNFVRDSGDDGLAMWSEKTSNARNTFDRNTVQTPVLAASWTAALSSLVSELAGRALLLVSGPPG